MGLGDPIADPIPKIARPLRRSDAVIEPVGAHGRLALLRHELGLQRLLPPFRRRREVAVADRPADQLRHEFGAAFRSEEHTSELQSLMRISYAVFCLKKKNNKFSQV